MTARQRRALAIVTGLVLTLYGTAPAEAYLKFGYELRGQQIALAWKVRPVPYFIADVPVANVPVTAFQNAVANAFATWQRVPTADITYRFAGFTSQLPGDDDGRSTLGFLDEPELDRVLAQTSFLVDESSGELIESDIFFNAAVPWSTAVNGEAGRWDVESIALHEIGHLSGLGHSAIGETENTATGRRMISSGSVMFPIALGPGNISLRVLQPDDIAGISDIYPDGGFNDTTGSMSGRVLKDGAGVFGAHVVAFNPATGAMVANFTLSQSGHFSIAGLPPGAYAVRVEPLDDADAESFLDEGVPVDADFKVAYASRLVVVPRGGDSGAVTVSVTRK